ncbi:hypothetical protein FDJ67_09905 [Clostridium sporogenes]|nr:hypothetical protein [Clostridium sporogenes]NFQ42320.1 hypothetical protein [Clostridium sporogenes]
MRINKKVAILQRKFNSFIFIIIIIRILCFIEIWVDKNRNINYINNVTKSKKNRHAVQSKKVRIGDKKRKFINK